MSGGPYWSSTSRAANKTQAWCATMGTGKAGFAARSDPCPVWPVRSSAAMLRDPRYLAKVWRTGQTTVYQERDDGNLDITDPIYILMFLFLGEKEPAKPFALCGLDPTDDALPCASFAPCE